MATVAPRNERWASGLEIVALTNASRSYDPQVRNYRRWFSV